MQAEGGDPVRSSAEFGQNWNSAISTFPEPHLLQSWEWGEVKSSFGWEAFYLVWPAETGCLTFRGTDAFPDLNDPPAAAALVLERTVPLRGFAARLRILYIPKGPLIRDWDDKDLRRRVLEGLKRMGKQRDAIFLKIDPDVPWLEGDALAAGSGVIQDLEALGWRFSREQVQFRNTVLVDLSEGETSLLERMKQKTRYNIRLAARKGVVIRQGTVGDTSMLYRMYAETSIRDGFVIREEGYYRTLWETFLGKDPSPQRLPKLLEDGVQPFAIPLIAEYHGEPIAALILFMFASKAWYLYGMSGHLHRETMPNYLLQWEAMRLARQLGCRVYDLWGAPDEFVETDPLWGVYRFKEGLGGQVERHIGAWDLPLKPLYYKLYTQILPRFLDILRRRGKEQIRQTLGT